MIQDQPQTLNVTNPVTGEILGRIHVATRSEVQAAVERARAAQPEWQALGLKERIRRLRRWGDWLWQHQEQAFKVICGETGKSKVGAYNEIVINDNVLTYYAYHAPRILRTQPRRALFPFFQRVRVHYKPHGVVGLITPWNYPFLLVCVDLVPALVAGNSVVIKPSEISPLSAQLAVETLIAAGVPPDVVQIVNGQGETGAALVDYVDYVAFTGSTAVGKQVAVRAAERLIPCNLELGGKDPMIVLADADLEKAVNGLLAGGLENAGQMCTSVERVYVEAPIYDDFVDRLAARAHDLILGQGFDAHLGSLTNLAELARVEAQVQDALVKGARVLHGGCRRPDLGPLFYEPTLLADTDHSMAVMQEETFGPVVPIMRVANAEEALRLANANAYGLSAVVYTRDLRHGETLARRIDSGDVGVNRPSVIWGAGAAPMGGQKASGIGRRGGPEGLLRFVTSQAVVLDAVPSALIPPDLMYFTPRMRWLMALRRRLLPFLPFLRP
jgi:succinate-semialdehyde dehydrogenase / glutarate-semialdehyde dehydrogenase